MCVCVYLIIIIKIKIPINYIYIICKDEDASHFQTHIRTQNTQNTQNITYLIYEKLAKICLNDSFMNFIFISILFKDLFFFYLLLLIFP